MKTVGSNPSVFDADRGNNKDNPTGLRKFGFFHPERDAYSVV